MDRMHSLGEIMPGLLERLPLEPVIVLRGLWKVLVGKALAERTEPVELRDGILRVAVRERAWKTPVQALEAELIGKINELAGQKLVRELRIELSEETPDASAEGRK